MLLIRYREEDGTTTSHFILQETEVKAPGIKVKGWVTVSLFQRYAEFPNTMGWDEQQSITFYAETWCFLYSNHPVDTDWCTAANWFNAIRSRVKRTVNGSQIITRRRTENWRDPIQICVYERDVNQHICGRYMTWSIPPAYPHPSIIRRSEAFYHQNENISCRPHLCTSLQTFVFECIATVLLPILVKEVIADYLSGIPHMDQIAVHRRSGPTPSRKKMLDILNVPEKGRGLEGINWLVPYHPDFE